MEISDLFMWFLVIVSIAWTVFLIVVMTAVLKFTKAATPYFERINAETLRAETAKHREQYPWAHE